MRFLPLVLLSLLLILPVISGAGLGGGGAGARNFVVDVPGNFVALANRDLGVDLEVDGTVRANERVFLHKTIDGVNYPVGRFTLSFRINDIGVDPSLDDIIALLDVDAKKAVIDIGDVSQASGLVDLYIPQTPGDNAIVVCTNSLNLAGTYKGCGGIDGIVEKWIYPGGYTGDFPVTEYVDDGIVTPFWRVADLTGTGIFSFFVNYGGGEETIIEEGGNIDLDIVTFYTYTSNENIEYTITVNEVDYLFVVDYVDPQNEYASVYIATLDTSFTLDEGGVENLDLDGGGEIDMTFEITTLDYPLVHAKVALFQPLALPTFAPREKDATDSKGIFSSSGNVWTRLLETKDITEGKLTLAVVSVLLVLLFFVFVGGKLLGKVWKAT